MNTHKIVIGADTIEKFHGLLCQFIRLGYKFYTTAFIRSELLQRGIFIDNIHVIEFSETDVESCLEYIFQNNLHNMVGINYGTAIYYASLSNRPLLTTDPSTDVICGALGISYININNNLFKKIQITIPSLDSRDNKTFNTTKDNIMQLHESYTTDTSIKIPSSI